MGLGDDTSTTSHPEPSPCCHRDGRLPHVPSRRLTPSQLPGPRLHYHECLHSIVAMSSTVGAIRSTEKHRWSEHHHEPATALPMMSLAVHALYAPGLRLPPSPPPGPRLHTREQHASTATSRRPEATHAEVIVSIDPSGHHRAPATPPLMGRRWIWV